MIDALTTRFASTAHVRARRRALWLVAAGITVAAAAALRFATVGLQSYWLDEAFTVQLARGSFGGLMHGVAATESNPPLYYVLALLWAKVFGTSEAALRSLSALAGTGTVAVVFLTGSKLMSRSAGLVAAGLVGASPLLVWYSQEARNYALYVFFTALAMLAFAYALDHASPKALGAWGAASALALATHYFAVFLFVAEALVLLARHRGIRARVVVACVPVVATGCALLPLAYHQHRLGGSAWIARLSLVYRVKQTITEFLVGNYPIAHRALFAVGIAAAAAVAAWVLVPRLGPAVIICLALAGAGLLLPLLLALTRSDVFYYRNVIGAFLPLSLAVAGLLAGSRRSSWVPLALVVTAALVAIDIDVSARPGLQRDDWRGVARALGPAAVDRVVVTTGRYDSIPLALALAGATEHGVREARVAELDVVERPGRLDVRAPTGFRLVARAHVQRFTVLRYRSQTLIDPVRGFARTSSASSTLGFLFEPSASVRP